jgi:hypothetical protein
MRAARISAGASIDRSQWRRLHPHGRKPRARLFGAAPSNARRIGLELEICLLDDYDREGTAREAFDVVDCILRNQGFEPASRDSEELFHAESDSSLSHGVEFVTSACTIRPSHRAWNDHGASRFRLGIDALVGYLLPKAHRDSCYTDCGLHVHLTRRDATEFGQPNHVRYYLACMNIVPWIMSGFAGRRLTAGKRWKMLLQRDEICPSYASCEFDMPQIKNHAFNGHAEAAGTERFRVFNLGNEKTVEFRACGNPWQDKSWHWTAAEIAESFECYLFDLAGRAGSSQPTQFGIAQGSACARVIESIRRIIGEITNASMESAWRREPILRFQAMTLLAPQSASIADFWMCYREFLAFHEPYFSRTANHLDRCLREFPIGVTNQNERA